MALETETRARLGGLLALARDAAAFRAVTSALDARRSIVLGEAGAGGRAYLYAALVAEASRTVCVVVPNEDRARRRAAVVGRGRRVALHDRLRAGHGGRRAGHVRAPRRHPRRLPDRRRASGAHRARGRRDRDAAAVRPPPPP